MRTYLTLAVATLLVCVWCGPAQGTLTLNGCVLHYNAQDIDGAGTVGTTGGSEDDEWVDIADVSIDSVYVAGEFNDWTPTSWRLTKTTGQQFTLAVPVTHFESQETWEFKFVINGTLWAEPNPALSVPTEVYELNRSRNLVLSTHR